VSSFVNLMTYFMLKSFFTAELAEIHSEQCIFSGSEKLHTASPAASLALGEV